MDTSANPVPHNQSLVVMTKWNEQGFLHHISSCTLYADLCGEIFRRFGFFHNDVIKLRYSLPNCTECFLDGDDDLKMLWIGASIYKLQSVEISVLKESAGASNGRVSPARVLPVRVSSPRVSSTRVSPARVSPTQVSPAGDSCSAIEEVDEFLGDGFRCENVKHYLSDEWACYINCVGQKFDNIDDFRDKLKKYAVGVGFVLKYKRNDGIYVHAICGNEKGGGGCNWFVSGSVASCSRVFYIRSLKNEHNCGGLLRRVKHRKLDSDLVMSCIEPDLWLNGSLRPKDVISQFKASYGFDITYKVAMKAAKKAKDRLYGREAESFNKLKWYKDAVTHTNPGSYFEMEVDESTGRFKRLFLAYAGCVRGFEYCLPVLYVDGTFGKNVYKGQVLAAIGKNGNKGMFPLAMCVCDSESEDNWFFFFSHLKKIIEPGGRAITFISDRGPVLLRAFDELFPGYLNLYCYKFLTYNLAKRFTGRGNANAVDMNKSRDLFFKLAYASTEKEYYHNLQIFRDFCGAAIVDPFLSNLPPQYWCRAFFKGCRYGIMANGLAESFNTWIRFERTMSVYSLLEEVRVKSMEMIGKRSLEAEDWTSKLTPEMEAHLECEMNKAQILKVHYSSPGVYEVNSDYPHFVNLNDRTCSCVKWQINCFPCMHALAAIQNSPRDDVYDFIDTYFYADTFRKCYNFPIHPISNVDEMFTDATSEYVHPPITRRSLGRRRTNRILSSGEQVKKSITCGRCHKTGNHNRLSCTETIE